MRAHFKHDRAWIALIHDHQAPERHVRQFVIGGAAGLSLLGPTVVSSLLTERFAWNPQC